MTGDQWGRVAELFESAVELPPGERDAFLDRACGAEPGLRAEVLALLDADATPHTILERGALTLLAGEGASGDDIGRRVGPFRVVSLLGAGGMGAVYLAERDDGQFEQRVALKLVRPGLFPAELRRRFEEERRLLARVVHPGIARILDGGLLPDGRPWLAMELVDGEPIDRAAARLPLRERLRLFADVCAAVHHAHGRLIVHRDLKPDNVLVTPGGAVKLLDFGIAKALEADGDPTHTVTRAMTPRYAAPEQIRGEPATTATDVYGLGALLHELLAGRPAFDVDGRSIAELARLICDVDPPPPSSRARGVPRDLDAICARALRKEPAQRYASADQLREDVLRFLRHEPVLARRGSWRYRAAKLLRRHRAAVTMMSLAALALGALVAIYTARLTRARDRAAASAVKADRVAAFLGELFASADPDHTRGARVTARELLEQGRRRIASQRLDPAVKADLMEVMGRAQRGLGQFADAAALLEASLALPGIDPLRRAATLHALGEVRLEQARVDEAETLMTAAYAMRRTALPEDDPAIVSSLLGLGAAARERGELDVAERRYDAALALARRRDPRDRVVGDLLSEQAELARDRGDYAACEALARQALAIHQAALGDDHPATVDDRFAVGDALRKQGHYAEAEPLYRETLAANERLYGDVHPATANSLNHVARLLYQQGRLDEAAPFFERAIAAYRRLYDSDNPALAFSLSAFAQLKVARGDTAAAEALYGEALAIMRHLNGDGLYAARLLAGLASVSSAAGRHEEAIGRFREALAMARAAMPANALDLAPILVGLGRALRDSDAAGEAEPLLAEAYAIRAAALPPDHPQVVVTTREWLACLAALARR